ncbi:MAG: hypothetical protein IPO02_11860 [Bacteroidetes bacterium]|nr:hypothetical protein [Bacteroidota bacterium]
MLGHAHINQTMVYLHLSSERIKAIANPYDILLAEKQNKTS